MGGGAQRRAALVSFRLAGPDGVSVEADKWAGSLRRLGWQTSTVAGAGEADAVIPGLALDAVVPPDRPALEAALGSADLVIVENLCSLPLNPRAATAVAETLAGRPAILHHHDLPWQRRRFATAGYRIPDDPHWRHVTINDLSRSQLEGRGLRAVTIRNAFDTDALPGDRGRTRAALGLTDRDRLLLQPTRAIARKNIPAALALASALGAAYWLLGPAEEGYDDELARLLSSARQAGTRCFHGSDVIKGVADAYAAADVVTFPSFWEGFGNPVIESAIYRRPLAIARYPVSEELAAFGFRWLDAGDPGAVRRWLDRPDPGWLDHNQAVARRGFSLEVLDRALSALVADVMRR